MRNRLRSGRLRGRRGARRGSWRRGRTAQGGDGDGGSWLLRCGSCRIFALHSPLPPLPALPRPARGPAGSLQGLPVPRRAFEEPRGGSRSRRRGEAGRGWGRGERAGFREGTGRERPGPVPWVSILRDSSQHPRDSGRRRPRAHPQAQRPARPRSALRLPPSLPPRLHAHTPPARPDPPGPRAPGRGTRGPRARVHTLRSTHPSRRATAQRATPRHTAHPPLAPTSSRVFNADAREPAGGGTRCRTTPGGAHAREVRAPPGRSPPAHPSLPGSPARAPHSLPRQPRTHCRPRCGCGCG